MIWYPHILYYLFYLNTRKIFRFYDFMGDFRLSEKGLTLRIWTCYTPHGTQDIPHIYHCIPHGTEHPNSTQDIPHGTEHPHSTQDIPHGTHDIPHGTEHPTVLKISSRVLMISHMVLNTPHGTEHPHVTAHTLYRVDTFCIYK